MRLPKCKVSPLMSSIQYANEYSAYAQDITWYLPPMCAPTISINEQTNELTNSKNSLTK